MDVGASLGLEQTGQGDLDIAEMRSGDSCAVPLWPGVSLLRSGGGC